MSQMISLFLCFFTISLSSLSAFSHSPTIEKNQTEEMKEFINLLRPVSVQLPKVRIGDPHDGGYIVVDGFEYDALYSYGVGWNIMFEEDFVSRHQISAYLFDHTISCIPDSNQRHLLHWKKEGVSFCQQDLLNTIKNQILLNNDTNKNDLFLKMDIEGSEWEVFSTIEESTLKQFKQIVVELHGLGDHSWGANMDIKLQALKNLKKNFEIVHVHANNFGGFHKTLTLPSVLEITLLRKDPDIVFLPLEEFFPIPYLDAPNNMNEPDYVLDYYPFKP